MADFSPLPELAAAAVVLLIGWITVRTATVRANLRELARRYHGRFESPFFFGPAAVRFTHRGCEVRVREARFDLLTDLRHIEVSIRGLPDAALSFAVVRRSWAARLGNFLRGPGRVRGFHARFRIVSAEPDRAAGALPPPVRRVIGRLHELSGRRNLELRLDGERLEVAVSGSAYYRADLFNIVEAVLMLQQRLPAAVAAVEAPGSIRILEVTDPARPPGRGREPPAVCPVCREDLANDVVLCRRCNTPHHGDCWSYGGGCAVYGCRELKSFRAR